jgi:hypothetical protein
MKPWHAMPERPRTELDTLSQVISANLTRAALEAAPVSADLSAGLPMSPARRGSRGNACSMRPRRRVSARSATARSGQLDDREAGGAGL